MRVGPKLHKIFSCYELRRAPDAGSLLTSDLEQVFSNEIKPVVAVLACVAFLLGVIVGRGLLFTDQAVKSAHGSAHGRYGCVDASPDSLPTVQNKWRRAPVYSSN